MRAAKNLARFAFGGGAYVGLEYLYRGRSHVSMFGAGGICYLLLGRLSSVRLPLPVLLGAGAGVITAVELGTGLLVNRDYHVWDYRELPGNFRGQICPQFAALWIPVSAMAMGVYQLTERIMDTRREAAG
ncbi:MAG: hypothetical protein IJO21_03575 [Oscillospiraceae bacterium]|nr:hypothetical protein [Oscillospiraceae bacterium]